ncbi:MAG: hypothetical protein ACFCAD_23640 [Pleurocapsa sp.]
MKSLIPYLKFRDVGVTNGQKNIFIWRSLFCFVTPQVTSDEQAIRNLKVSK